MNEPSPTKQNIWISVLLVAVVAGLTAGSVYYWQHLIVNDTKSSDQSKIASLNGKISGLTKQLDTANTKIKTLSQPTAPATATVDDKTAITNVVTADCEARVGFKILNMTPITVTSPFATVVATCTEPGLTNEAGDANERILKKIDEQWVIIDRPTNGIDATTRQNYGIPASIQ